MKFPYGISDFRQVIGEGYYFVDRSDHIRILEEIGKICPSSAIAKRRTRCWTVRRANSGNAVARRPGSRCRTGGDPHLV